MMVRGRFLSRNGIVLAAGVALALVTAPFGAARADADVGSAAAGLSDAKRSTAFVIAIDEISALGVPLRSGSAAALKALVHAKFASLGWLRVLPEAAVAAQIKALRRQGVAACGAGACQMALGVALAAQGLVVPKLVRLPDRCMALLTLYDVASATAELATTEDCVCEEGAFVAALLRASQALATGLFQMRAAAAPRVSPTVSRGRVSLFVRSRPSQMPLWLDGALVGRTPKVLSVERGVAHRLKVGAWPYRPAEQTVASLGWQQVELRLERHRDDPKDVALTDEWFALGFGGGFAVGHSQALVGAELRLFQWRWSHLSWTAIELRIAFGTERSTAPGARDLLHISTYASRLAFPLYWGRYGTHQLQLGLGAGLWAASFSSGGGRVAFAALPSLDYLHLSANGALSLGVGVNLALPLTSGAGTRDAPLALLLSLKLGIAPSAPLRARNPDGTAGTRPR